MSQQWNPLQDLMLLQDRMNRLFEDATQRRVHAETEGRDEIERAEWYPAADVYEDESEYLVALDLPGIDRSALDISIDDNRLAIRGTRSTTQRAEHRSERPRGRFVRTFGIPGVVDQQQIRAEYQDGVLQLHLPKRREPKAQRVEIKVS